MAHSSRKYSSLSRKKKTKKPKTFSSFLLLLVTLSPVLRLCYCCHFPNLDVFCCCSQIDYIKLLLMTHLFHVDVPGYSWKQDGAVLSLMFQLHCQ